MSFLPVSASAPLGDAQETALSRPSAKARVVNGGVSKKRKRKLRQEELQLEEMIFGTSTAAQASSSSDSDSSDDDSDAEVASDDEDDGSLLARIQQRKAAKAAASRAVKKRKTEAGSDEGNDEDSDDEGDSDEEGADLFNVLGAAGGGDGGDESSSSDSESGSGSESDDAVWHDEDDDEVMVDISASHRLRKLRQNHEERKISGAEYMKRLRSKHSELARGATQPSWAQSKTPEDGEDDDSDEEMDNVLQSTGSVSSNQIGSSESGVKLLPGGRLRVSRVKDANLQERARSSVRSVRFHAKTGGRLLLTAGLDKRVRLFQIDGVNNYKVQSFFLKDMPIWQAEFRGDSEIIVAGRRKFFYAIDLNSNVASTQAASPVVSKIPGLAGRPEKSLEKFCVSPDGKYIAFHGRSGTVHLVSGTTKQWIGSVKMNPTSNDIGEACFTPDSSQLVSASGGRTYLWDVGTRRCITQQVDEGVLHSTALAVSSDRRYFATGSGAGIANLYEGKSLFDASPASSASADGPTGPLAPQRLARPSPAKAITNLTTQIDMLRFNHDSQILAFGSTRSKDSLRLLHVPSMSVFSNWPTQNTPLNNVSAVDFSPHSGFLAVGNAKGNVLMFRLHHYRNL